MPGESRHRRADAVRNRAAILDAALRTLNADPGASIADIAAEAGISRITFYGHFASRDQLLEELGTHVIDRIDTELAATAPADGSWPTLQNVIRAQWRLVDELSGFIQAAEQHLPAERIHALHAGPLARVRQLIQDGRDDGSFRTDHTIDWQTACLFAILHGAAAEFRSGRLSESDAAHVIPQTVHALLASTRSA